MDIGVDRAGFKTVCAVESDPHCASAACAIGPAPTSRKRRPAATGPGNGDASAWGAMSVVEFFGQRLAADLMLRSITLIGPNMPHRYAVQRFAERHYFGAEIHHHAAYEARPGNFGEHP